jgi:hypothetical protein
MKSRVDRTLGKGSCQDNKDAQGVFSSAEQHGPPPSSYSFAILFECRLQIGGSGVLGHIGPLPRRSNGCEIKVEHSSVV